jgi:hypothetical protein
MPRSLVRRSVTGSRLGIGSAVSSDVLHSSVLSDRPFVSDGASNHCARKDAERSNDLVRLTCCSFRKTLTTLAPLNERSQERQARPLVVGCSTETGSDAGKVFLRASSSASSWRLRLSLSPSS